MIVYSEGATKAQEDEANMILDALTTAYPGHPWGVRVYGNDSGGGFFIRHLDFPANYGMNCTYKAGHHYSASALKRQIILMAGEWLERANLKRGRSNGDEIGRVEGVPEKYQPASLDMPVQIVTGERETVRPEVLQAVEQLKSQRLG